MGVPRSLVDLTDDGGLRPTNGAGRLARIWPYTQKWVWPVRMRSEALVDPVNLVVAGVGADDVLALLIAWGWAVPGDGATHRLWVDGHLRRMACHVALGPHAERTHVRLWQVAGHTIAAAHHEVADAHGHHVVDSWDRARDDLRAALAGSGLVERGPSEPVTIPDLRGVPGDGRAVVLAAG